MIRKSVSIKDVARKAGCSQVTVARVFSGAVRVSEKRRNNVLAAAKELGYSTNILARGLRGGGTNSVAVFFVRASLGTGRQVPDIISQLFWDNEKKVSFLGQTSSDDVLAVILDDLLQRHFDGMIIELPISIKNKPFEVLKKFPAAVIISAEKQNSDMDQIIWDRTSGIREAVNHFVKTGRREIGFLADAEMNRTKYQAFISQMRKHRMDTLKTATLSEAWDMHDATSCYETLSSLKNAAFPFDAIICGNDNIAVAAMKWLSDKGIRVPEDVAITGFDNDSFSEFLPTPLASVDRKKMETAHEAYKLLSARMKNPGLPQKTVRIPMSFVWRQSAG